MKKKSCAAALIVMMTACTSSPADQAVTSPATQNAVSSGPVSSESGTSESVETTSTTEPTTTTTEPTTTTTEPPEPLPLGSFGISVPDGRASRVFEVEQSLGANFDLIRWFARWDTPIPNPELDELVRTGHAIHISVRPRTDSGRDILWADLATAQPGDDLYTKMESIIDNVASIGPNVYFTFNHEPETQDSKSNGSATEFIGAWRQFYDILRDRTGPLTDPSDPNQIAAIYTVGNSGFEDGRAEEFYPGDEYVDVIGADMYNWYTCQGSDREWVQLTELLEPGVAFARSRNKPLAIPEFGSAVDPADPEAKGEWMRQAAVALNSPELADLVLFSAWFDVTAPGGAWPNCVWDHDSSFETFQGFSELVRASTKSGQP